MIFDFRVRLGPHQSAADELISIMDRYGIEAAAVTAGAVIALEQLSAQIVYGGASTAEPDNERVLAACAATGDRLVPIYFANPHTDSYRSRGAGFRGVEISPAVHGVALTDPRTERIVRRAAGFGHAVYLVTLGRAGARVTDLVALAKRFGEVTFVLGHGGFLGIDLHAITEIAPHRNILVETSGCFTALARHAIARLGSDRVLFGTEYPLQHPSVELAKYAALELPEAAWAQIAWQNAIRLLRPALSKETP